MRMAGLGRGKMRGVVGRSNHPIALFGSVMRFRSNAQLVQGWRGRTSISLRNRATGAALSTAS